MDELKRFRHIHLVGAGGAGMSGLAKLLDGLGWKVTGSDVRQGGLAALSELGIEVWAGHDPARAVVADLVVASSAVPDTDPEIEAASGLGIEVWRRPRLLEAVTTDLPTIGAAGTHGKTSTSALLVTALLAAGRDPSFVVGGELMGLGTNAAVGADPLLVLEVDEAFRTFELVHLAGLVVTNVEADHVEHYGNVDEIEEAFVAVARRVAGPVVSCLDDPGARRVAERADTSTYGLDPRATWRVGGVVQRPGAVTFRLEGPAGAVVADVPNAGLHTARNAAGALALCGEMGVDLSAAAAGLGGFGGVRRRFEHRGTVAGVVLVDDYAHHPTEVAATLRAARASHQGRIWAVFQPHLYSRTERLHREFGTALSLADRVVVCDVYGAREAPRPGISGELVAAAAQRAGADVRYVPHRAELAPYLADHVDPGDLVLTMGAGDITTVPGELLGLLAERNGS